MVEPWGQPRPQLHRHSQAWYVESEVTGHATSAREAFVECQKSRNRWRKFIVWNVQAGVMTGMCFIILATDFQLMASI